MSSLIIGLITSSLIILLSQLSYRNYVRRGVSKFEQMPRDEIDKIEDPHDLYSEDSVDDERDFKEIIKEEKRKGGVFKKSTFKALPIALSPFRLLGYFLFVIGFIYLEESGDLNIGLYLTGVTVGIVIPPLLSKYLLNRKSK